MQLTSKSCDIIDDTLLRPERERALLRGRLRDKDAPHFRLMTERYSNSEFCEIVGSDFSDYLMDATVTGQNITKLRAVTKVSPSTRASI